VRNWYHKISDAIGEVSYINRRSYKRVRLYISNVISKNVGVERMLSIGFFPQDLWLCWVLSSPDDAATVMLILRILMA
jgi:hypothetical protein